MKKHPVDKIYDKEIKDWNNFCIKLAIIGILLL